MRIAYTHPHCWPDVRRGGERYLHELATSAARRGHDVTILSTSVSSPGTREEEGVTVIRLGRRPGSDHAVERSFGARILPRLLTGGYDVVHSLMPSDALAATASRRARRVGRAVYTNLGIPDREVYRRRRDRRWHAAAVRAVEVYGCLSEAAASSLRADYRRESVMTPGGVRLEHFPLAPSRSEQPTLLYSGTFDAPMKRVPVLLKAFGVLTARHPDLRLQLTGPGDVDGHLVDLAPQVRGRIEVLPLGNPDLAPVYGAAWGTVLPSKGESFALALLESLACGTPVVAARHGAGPERVAPGAGALCTLDDVPSLVQACEEVLELADDPATAARCRAVAAPFDWDALAPRYEAVYECGEGTPSALRPAE